MIRWLWRRLLARLLAFPYKVSTRWENPYIVVTIQGPEGPGSYATEPGYLLAAARGKLLRVVDALPTEFVLWDAKARNLVRVPGYLAAKMLRALPPC